MKALKSIILICPECKESFQAHKTGEYYCSNECWYKGNRYILAEKRLKRDRAKKYALTGSPLYAPIL